MCSFSSGIHWIGQVFDHPRGLKISSIAPNSFVCNGHLANAVYGIVDGNGLNNGSVHEGVHVPLSL